MRRNWKTARPPNKKFGGCFFEEVLDKINVLKINVTRNSRIKVNYSFSLLI